MILDCSLLVKQTLFQSLAKGNPNSRTKKPAQKRDLGKRFLFHVDSDLVGDLHLNFHLGEKNSFGLSCQGKEFPFSESQKKELLEELRIASCVDWTWESVL